MRVAIVGGSGYAGGELLRLLLLHPETEIEHVTSSTYAGEYIYNVHPNLRGYSNLKFSKFDPETIGDTCDTVFLATPHGVSRELVPRLLNDNLKVVDLSADFRLQNPEDYPKWYGWEHPYPSLLEKAVYGLPELYRASIQRAKLVACPGCMAGATILALSPLIQNQVIDTRHIIIDVKIGSSGGGSLPTYANHHTERFGGVHPYKVSGHRHIAEIEQELSSLCDQDVSVGFTPHAVNMARGILVTAHLWLTEHLSERDVWKAFREKYQDQPFIRLVKSKKGLHRLPDPRNVVGTNLCDIGFELDKHVDRLIVFSAIDNIVKGAAGQAVQCYNLMNGFNERAGLNLIGSH